jgi:tRNA threonylcarbamoyladenosine biosynthesis protein TsaE
LTTGAPTGTAELAASIAPLCVPGDVLLLAGDLGAGKTTFAQGFGRALGVTEPVTSPTFTLVRQYPLPGTPSPSADGRSVRTFFHADVWRLGHLQEIADLGLGQLVEDGGVALVEWGDVAQPVLGQGSLTVRLVADEFHDERRTITVGSEGDTWSDRWPSLESALTPWLVGP